MPARARAVALRMERGRQRAREEEFGDPEWDIFADSGNVVAMLGTPGRNILVSKASYLNCLTIAR